MCCVRLALVLLFINHLMIITVIIVIIIITHSCLRAKKIMDLIGQFFLFFYFKKFWFWGFFVVGTTGQVCFGVCMREFCAFAQMFSVRFFTHILACMKILFWAFFAFCFWLFCMINCKMSVAVFLFVSFLHFVSCGHIRIV